MLAVATVNVNGIRAAFRRGMGAWLAARRPDVLLLQEVRAEAAHLAAHLGPSWHVAYEAGREKGRAGVAVASRWPLLAVRRGLGIPGGATGEGPPEVLQESAGRWVEVELDVPGHGRLTAASVYVHKGEAATPRMDPKLAFLDAITGRLGELAAGSRRAVVGGDLNIAHTEADLRNWRGNVGRAGFLPVERAYLDRWLGDGAWDDVARRLAGERPGPYTWWSWRGRAFDADAGWRIDYQLATAPLARCAREAAVDRAPSYAERFSDHAPLVISYDTWGTR